MVRFRSFRGVITKIDDFYYNAPDESGCYKQFTLVGERKEIVNFVVSPTTYFVDHTAVTIGDTVSGYYDGNAPAILIYPPQYPAMIMVKESPYQNVKVDYFNHQLLSSDGDLKLNLSPHTQIMLMNNQPFMGNPANRNLIVVYGPSTRSIPAQTTPLKIIVWCTVSCGNP